MFPMWLSWACIHLFNHTSTIIMLHGTRVAKAFQLQKLPNLVARIVTYYSYCKKFELWCKISSYVGLVKPVFHFTISLAASEIFPQWHHFFHAVVDQRKLQEIMSSAKFFSSGERNGEVENGLKALSHQRLDTSPNHAQTNYGKLGFSYSE